jgi:hypothetical protein
MGMWTCGSPYSQMTLFHVLRYFEISELSFLYIFAAIVSSLIWTFCAHWAFYGAAAVRFGVLFINDQA